jgi:hypothetical protein
VRELRVDERLQLGRSRSAARRGEDHVVLPPDGGDLFTQPGAEHPPLTPGDILGPSEASRAAMDYFAHSAGTRGLLEKLAATGPRTLACMHGSAGAGDGRRLLLDLADALAPAALP